MYERLRELKLDGPDADVKGSDGTRSLKQRLSGSTPQPTANQEMQRVTLGSSSRL
jgi:hypothetical protein